MSIDAQQLLRLSLDAAAKGLLQLGTAMHKHDCIYICLGLQCWLSVAKHRNHVGAEVPCNKMCILLPSVWTTPLTADIVVHQLCGRFA